MKTRIRNTSFAMLEESGLSPVREMVDFWLARAENPAPGMESELMSAKAKIQQLEHELKEDRKMFDIKHQEDILKAEKHEKVILMMAREIKNIKEGKEPEISNQKDKALEKANKELAESKNETKDVSEKLEKAYKDNEEVTNTMNILKKVVESVTDNLPEKKSKQNKKNIKCREVSKPNGCSWGTKCKFDHGEYKGLGKQTDCTYWMEGHCRFTE